MAEQSNIYLIKRYGKILIHVGIYVNDDLVYHYATRRNCALTGGHIVKKSTAIEFSLNRRIEYIFLQKIQLDIVDRRAEEFSRMSRSYNLITNNCVTFLLYCLKGEKISVLEMVHFALYYKVIFFPFRVLA